MNRVLTVFAFALCALPWRASAATLGDEVVVIYNSRLPESKSVAEYYTGKRQVPTNQVFGFDLSTDEAISRSEFREKLQRPLADILSSKKLWRIGPVKVQSTTNQSTHTESRVVQSKIRYAVLCYGVPLRIEHDASIKEEGTDGLKQEMLRNGAAVDSELAMLPLIEQKYQLAGPLRNPVFTSTNEAFMHPTNGVLMVTRLDGPSAALARGLVDKALEAEHNGLWGRAYFDTRSIADPTYKLGDDWIRGACEICRHLGFDTVLDTNAATFPAGFPMSQIAIYIGWYDEHASGPFTRPAVEFMPGAFAYHLHSFSAATVRSATRRWVGPLVAEGATITMGCVDEPYLAGTPDVAIFVARLVFNQFTFGEAAYASQGTLSWQTTFVGDPLYRPFGRNAEEVHDELMRTGNKLVDWSFLRLVNMNLVNGKPLADGVTFLEGIPNTKNSAVLTEKLGDLYLAQGKPSSAVHAYQRALKLDPSPVQRLRLRLTVGEKLVELDRNPEAYENYQQILQEVPDYSDKLSIYRRLLALAQKLDKKEEAQKYTQEINQLSAHP
jgi:uncharacterized protein (TIGR03790 family)